MRRRILVFSVCIGPASDGWVFTHPTSMTPVGEAEEAPDAFEAGDLLFGVSPADMEYFAVRVVR